MVSQSIPTKDDSAEAGLHQIVQRLQVLSDAARDLLVREDPLQLLDSIYGRLAEHFDLDFYFYFAVSSDGKPLELRACRGMSAETAQQIGAFHLDEQIGIKASDEAKAIVITDIDQLDGARSQLLRGLGITAYVSHPLIAHGRFIGTLSFGTHRATLSPEVVEVMRALSDMAATTISRRQAEEALRESEERLRLTRDAAEVGTWDWDLISGRVVWDEQCRRIFGIASDEKMTYERSFAALHPEDRQHVHQAVQDALSRCGNYHTEYRVVWPSGEVHWILVKGRAVCGSSGEAVRLSGVAMEITTRKQAEEQLKASLEEKEMLLREVHHRVKNNLQVVSSLLTLQSEKLTDKAARAVFKECRERIHSMARLHRQLYARGEFARLDFGGYIKELAEMLVEAHTSPGQNVKLQIDTQQVEVDLDTAVPLSLIAHEIILNSLKHAFGGGRSGTLAIRWRAGSAWHEMIFADDGPGFPQGFTPANSGRMGLQLVIGLSRQIRGEAKFENKEGGGSITTITFPAALTKQSTSEP
jgi:PAS domain S-box-containing protein